MSTAGSIVIDLLMRTGSFETDARRAEQRIKSMERNIKAAGAAVAAATTAALVGVTALVKGAIDSADALAKASRTIGMSTEALGAYQYAAELSGLSSDLLTTSLQRLNRAAVEAAEGSKTQATAFAALGVSVLDINGQMRDSEAIMLDVVDAFSRLEDGPQKTALAMDLFGRAGADMVSFLNLGKDGLAALRQEFRDLGLEIDGDTAQAAERFNDNMTRLKKRMDAFAITVATGVMPQLEAFSQELQNPETIRAAQALASAVVAAFNAITAAIRNTVGAMRWMGESLAAIRFGAAIDDIVRLEDELGKLQGMLTSGPMSRIRIGGTGGIVAYWTDAELEAEIARVKGAIDDYYNRPPPQITMPAMPTPAGAPPGLDFGAEAPDTGGGGGGGRSRGGGGGGADNRLMIEARLLYESTRTAAEQYAETIAKLNQLRAVGAIDQDLYNRGVTQADEAMSRARETLMQGLLTEEEEIKYSYRRRQDEILRATEITEVERQEMLRRLQVDFDERMAEARGGGYWASWLKGAENAMRDFDALAAQTADAFSSRFGDAFESVIFDSQSLGDAIYNLAEGMARSIVNAIGQMAAQWLVYQAVTALTNKGVAATAATAQSLQAAASQQLAAVNAYASTAAIPIVGPAAAPAAAATAMAATAPFVAGVTSLAAAAAAARADGGPISPGRPYLVGERGPELFVPNTVGGVIPNHKLGGPNIQVNLIEDRRRAGQTETRQRDEQTEMDVFVADIMGNGPRSQALAQAYGLQRRGY